MHKCKYSDFNEIENIYLNFDSEFLRNHFILTPQFSLLRYWLRRQLSFINSLKIASKERIKAVKLESKTMST